MIERMKVLQIVTDQAHKEEMLENLRELGVLHFAERQGADENLISRFNLLSRTVNALMDYAPKKPNKELLPDAEFEELFDKTVSAIDRKKDLLSQRGNAVSAMDRIRAWGEFNPDDVKNLKQDGIELHFYKVDKRVYADLCKDDSVKFIKLAPVEKTIAIASIGTLPTQYAAIEFVLPDRGLAELKDCISSCDKEIAEIESFLKEASQYIPSFNAQMLKTQNDEECSAVRNTFASDSGLVWLSGYIPESAVDAFKKTAKANSWAYAMDDADEDDESVPTKVKYNKFTRLIAPVFDILGTIPGYMEYDISFWFLCFFTLFFAMIVGDAAYGFIFLAFAIVLNVKLHKANDAVLLLYVLSIATIIWGALTGTWFGSEAAMKIPLLRALVIPTFANYPEYFGVDTTTQQNAVMKFCFIVGTIHLSLACVMNIRKKLKTKDLSLLADFGWLCAIDALYFVVLVLVIGEDFNLVPFGCVVAFGFLMVVFFGAMGPGVNFKDGFKAGLASAFTVFLNTISAFGNVMSYIRLFAVGMASLAISQSFNSMAAGFTGPMVIIGALIVIFGHVLNIVMALLSVVVHGVRLNLLEFSGQLGMEWSGIAYNPFKKLDKIKR